MMLFEPLVNWLTHPRTELSHSPRGYLHLFTGDVVANPFIAN